MPMVMTLSKVLGLVAKAKEVKNPKKWVAERLHHAQVESDYKKWVALTSDKNYWFGVEDAEFPCGQFILYTEQEVAEDRTTVHKFYTFNSLNGTAFIGYLMDAFQYFWESTKDLKLFFNKELVDLRVYKANGEEAKLGEYYDFHEGFSLSVDFYTVNLIDFRKNPVNEVYFKDKGMMELYILTNLTPYFEKEEGVYEPLSLPIFVSDVVQVRYKGQKLRVGLIKEFPVEMANEEDLAQAESVQTLKKIKGSKKKAKKQTIPKLIWLDA